MAKRDPPTHVTVGRPLSKSLIYRATTRQQLRVMNNTRRSVAEWAAARWCQHGQEATEGGLQRGLHEIGWEIVDVTRHLRPRPGLQVLQLPWDKWAVSVPGNAVAVCTDAGARGGEEGTLCSRVGLVTRIGGRWWGMAVPLEPWVDNTTGELLGITLKRHIVAHRSGMGAAGLEHAYDAQAAAVLAEAAAALAECCQSCSATR